MPSSRPAVEVCRQQFDSCYRMLCRLVDVCPDEVWRMCPYGFPYPVWHQVYHVAYFIDYWLREAYDGSGFPTMAFDSRIAPEFEHEPPADALITRPEMSAYLRQISNKLTRFFASMNDEQLTQPIIADQPNFTYLDVIITQIRHIMYNVGYVNGILRSLDLPESDWYAYNETDD